MKILLFSMPDSFEHMPEPVIRMPNGALTYISGNGCERTIWHPDYRFRHVLEGVGHRKEQNLHCWVDRRSKSDATSLVHRPALSTGNKNNSPLTKIAM